MTTERERITRLVAIRVFERRGIMGLTQLDVTRRCGWAGEGQMVSHIECGRRLPGAMLLLDLADALACSTDYLLGRTDEPR